MIVIKKSGATESEEGPAALPVSAPLAWTWGTRGVPGVSPGEAAPRRRPASAAAARTIWTNRNVAIWQSRVLAARRCISRRGFVQSDQGASSTAVDGGGGMVGWLVGWVGEVVNVYDWFCFFSFSPPSGSVIVYELSQVVTKFDIYTRSLEV